MLFHKFLAQLMAGSSFFLVFPALRASEAWLTLGSRSIKSKGLP